MKKLLSLIGALLLWQSVAVAQNYLHITSGDSTKIVRMAELDSVTVRDKDFYKPSFSNVDGLRFSGNVDSYFGDSFTFDVTLAQGEGTTVYIQNLDPYFAQYGYTAENGYNILAGELAVAEDGNSATITCQPNQAVGYQDGVFANPFGGETISFTLTEATFTCETGYGVGTSEGWYTAFNPFTLKKVTRTAAPARRTKAVEPLLPKAAKQLKPMTAPEKQEAENAKMRALELMPVPTDNTIK